MNPPVLAVALHDGWYGAGTGAGRSNRALIEAAVGALRPGVRLLVLPVHLDRSSPEYQPGWHKQSAALLKAVPHDLLPLDNGTGGRQRFGDLAAFQHLAAHTAATLAKVMRRHPNGALIAIDQPFAGLGPLLPPSSWPLLYLPRSSAVHHADPQRAAWERQGLHGWLGRGAQFGAISRHMRQLLAEAGIPGERILDVPGGLTPADQVPLDQAPPLPAAARRGFVLCMGRAEPYKGWDDLLDATAWLRRRGEAVPHLVLAAVTDAPDRTAYQQHLADRIDAEHLDATLWTRFDHGVPGLLRHPVLRMVVVPSREEPLGRIPLEAFAAGAGPVVATTAGGLAETVLDGVTGYSCEPAAPVSLAAAMLRALRCGRDTVVRLREAGARLAAARDYTTCVTGALAVFAPWAVKGPVSMP